MWDQLCRVAQALFALTSVAVVAVVAASLAATAHAQTPVNQGRIAGQVKDMFGEVASLVPVTLTAEGVSRTIFTDVEGRYRFESLNPKMTYAVKAESSGLVPAVREGVIVTAGESVTIDLVLRIRCYAGDPPLIVVPSHLGQLLMADAVVHVRIAGAAGTAGAEDECHPRRDAIVLGAAKLSRPEWQAVSRIALAADFGPGEEYLLFLTYDPSSQRFSGRYSRLVVDGRVSGPDNNMSSVVPDDDLGIPDGMPVDQALTRLRQLDQRNRR